MDVRALARKEGLTVRRHLGVFLLLLILFPAVFTLGINIYDQDVPEDIPIAVVPADEHATEGDIDIIRGGVTFFATPVVYDDPATARDDLDREQVYLVVEVPGRLTEAGAAANFTVVSDQNYAPFREPANLTVELTESYLDAVLPADVEVTHERAGQQRGYSSFLVPSGFMAFIVFYALLFVPHQLHAERAVLDRLRMETRLETVVGTKLAFHAALLLVPAVVVALVTAWLGHDVAVLAPFTIGVLALSFLLLAAVGLAILFAFQLRRAALLVNFAIGVAIIGTSGFVYPIGFFTPLQVAIARASPAHYAVVTTRSAMLRDAPVALYGDYLAYMGATLVVALVALAGAIEWYRRRR